MSNNDIIIVSRGNLPSLRDKTASKLINDSGIPEIENERESP
jgi:hypothetical protein